MCKHTVELKPGANHIACDKVVGEKLRSSPTLVCVKPALVLIQGICMASVLTYTSAGSSETQKKEASASAKSTGFESHSSCSELESESNIAQGSSPEMKELCDMVVLMVANFIYDRLTVPKGTVLEWAREYQRV
jgi:hypothetical protein